MSHNFDQKNGHTKKVTTLFIFHCAKNMSTREKTRHRKTEENNYVQYSGTRPVDRVNVVISILSSTFVEG